MQEITATFEGETVTYDGRSIHECHETVNALHRQAERLAPRFAEQTADSGCTNYSDAASAGPRQLKAYRLIAQAHAWNEIAGVLETQRDERRAQERLSELHELRLASINGDGRAMTVLEMQELDRREAQQSRCGWCGETDDKCTRCRGCDQHGSMIDGNCSICYVPPQDDESELPDELECYECGGFDGVHFVMRRVVKLGAVVEQRRDPTQTYVLECGHVTI